ncbi:caspase family protein [Methylorubrum sp. Q1]|uniref:caspase family protein n=1 Tax=Methylorubrum sp. Q1 TaxID=2562453 RepID=UPI0010766264|nr:caspase family protein [Methylorubrum sp. Q1]TFZ54824.1 caspase family protein [Methylorubrum sp. Q1]
MAADDFAIVIGVSEYTQFPALSAAENDALAFYEWLIDPNGGDVPPARVARTVVSDLLPAQRGHRPFPVKDDVDDKLTPFIAKQTGRVGRRLYVYFSGHGCVPDVASIALLMSNAGTDLLGRNIGAERYRDVLTARAHFDELVFFLDCCASASASAELGAPPWPHQNRHPDFSKVRALVGVGTEIGHVSYAPEDPNGRSFFTEALLEGLRGKAADDSGAIDGESLSRWVKERVPVLALRAGKLQKPDFPVKAGIVFRQGVQGAPASRLITFKVADALVERPLTVRDGSLKVVRTFADTGPSRRFQALLTPGLYEVEYPSPAGARQINVHVGPSLDPATLVLEPNVGKIRV